MIDGVPVDGSNVRLKNHRRFNGVGGKPAMNLVRFFVKARQSGFPVSATEVLDVDNGHGFEDRRHFMSFVDYDVSCDASEVVRFYLTRLVDELDADMSEVAEANLDKLFDRKERDKIQGSGDNR